MLKISEGHNNGVSVLSLQGNVIMGVPVSQLRDAVGNTIKHGRNKIVFDFSGVKYLDSSGIAELVATMVSLNKTGGQLALCNLGDRVNEVLELSSLLAIFETFDTSDEAVQALCEV